MKDKQQARPTLRDVEQFWSTNPCNSSLGQSDDRRKWFLEIESNRYTNESHIPEIANFSSYKGKQILEVGSGVGTDGRRFAEAGAKYIGINLDVGSCAYSREAMDLFSFSCPILQMDAERLAFHDGQFDHVYSFGAVHHSPRPEVILRELYRVLAPGGTLRIMLYNKNSINYYFEIMFLRKMLRFALMPKAGPRLLSKAIGLDQAKLERHREILLDENMTHDRWVSINTDGPDCPLAKVYTRSQGVAILEAIGFRNITTSVHFFDKRHYGRLAAFFPARLIELLGRKWGWHLILNAQKPSI